MDTTLQISLAKRAGKIENENTDWEEQYLYHLGMIKDPLPFGQFRLKYIKLNRLLKDYPEGKKPSYDEAINDLCNQLGY